VAVAGRAGRGPAGGGGRLRLQPLPRQLQPPRRLLERAAPVLAACWWPSASPDVNDARAWLVMTVTIVWSVRLTGNWVRAFPDLHHEDWRYPLLKEKAGRWEPLVDLVAIHVVPTLQVFLGIIPVYVAVTRTGRDVGWLDAVALAVGLGASRASAPSRSTTLGCGPTSGGAWPTPVSWCARGAGPWCPTGSRATASPRPPSSGAPVGRWRRTAPRAIVGARWWGPSTTVSRSSPRPLARSRSPRGRSAASCSLGRAPRHLPRHPGVLRPLSVAGARTPR
jgi:hypothetical protein